MMNKSENMVATIEDFEVRLAKNECTSVSLKIDDVSSVLDSQFVNFFDIEEFVSNFSDERSISFMLQVHYRARNNGKYEEFISDLKIAAFEEGKLTFNKTFLKHENLANFLRERIGNVIDNIVQLNFSAISLSSRVLRSAISLSCPVVIDCTPKDILDDRKALYKDILDCHKALYKYILDDHLEAFSTYCDRHDKIRHDEVVRKVYMHIRFGKPLRFFEEPLIITVIDNVTNDYSDLSTDCTMDEGRHNAETMNHIPDGSYGD